MEKKLGEPVKNQLGPLVHWFDWMVHLVLWVFSKNSGSIVNQPIFHTGSPVESSGRVLKHWAPT